MAELDAEDPPTPWSASQVVAHNLARARRLRGLSQAEVAERLTRFTGAKWGQVAVSQAECSVSGQRVRQFTANELVGLARTFDLPLLYFFMPPDDGQHGLAAPDAPPQGWSWPYLYMLVWGHRDNSAVVAERMGRWAHVLPMFTEVDRDDADQEGAVRRFAEAAAHGEGFSPDEVLALALNGLLHQHMDPWIRPEEVEKLASQLRWLASMFEAFDADPPGTYFDFDVLRRLAASKRNPGSVD
jgi:transcriptional regulator with XRE-family HTH domain